MALTITIPGAVETTTGSTAPAVLTVGVGSPGQGVPSGGTSGQVLQKLSGVSYDTGWLTLPADFITSVTAPMVVTGTDLSVDLSAYSTTAQAAALYYPLSGNPSGFLTAVVLTNLTGDISWDGSANAGRLLIAGVNDIGGGNTEARLNFQSGVPTQPATGDFWSNGTDFFYRESGSTKTIASQSYVSANFYPLSGNPSAFLVAADITGKANLASPTFTGTPTLPTGTIATTQTALDSSTKVATTAFVTTADNLKANLASPTFTGAPTLPTGSIGVTQSPGNNTTALATTAFVTAAVPAFATDAQARLGQSKTVTSSPYAVSLAQSNPSTYQWTAFNSSTSGAGATNNNYGQYVYEQDSPNALTAGTAALYSRPEMSWVNGGSVSRLTFTNPVWISGKILKAGGFAGDANNSYRSYVGQTDTGGTPGGGDPVNVSVGIKFTGGAAQVFKLMVHNGTTQTLVSGTTTIASDVVYEWMVYSDGAGNATMFINGVQEATTAAGPTGTASSCYSVQAIGQTVTAVTRMILLNRNAKVVVGN